MMDLPYSNICFDQLKIDAFHELGDKLFINDRCSENHELIREQFLKKLAGFPKRVYKELPLLIKRCPFCVAKLETCNDTTIDEDNGVEITAALEYCRKCRYWRWHYLDTEFRFREGIYVHDYTSFISKLRDFESYLPGECSSDIAQWIRRNSKKWHTISPKGLEKLVTDIFKANFVDANVYHVGKPDDGGVDVVFVESNNCSWLIQVKRRANPNASEPVETIRNLLGTMILEKSSLGMVVSTADHFTYRAYEAIGRAKELGLMIRLINRQTLDLMLDPLLPDRTWLEPIHKLYPYYANKFASKLGSDLQLRFF